MVTLAVASPIGADPGSGRDATLNGLVIQGTVTLSGNYGGASTHGDTVDFSGVCATDYAPRSVTFYQEPTAGVGPIAYTFLYGRGTTIANGVLIVNSAGGGEITQGAAYPAALTAAGANIWFRANFAKNV